MASLEYVGGELELFAAAMNWKTYLRRQIQPHLGHRVMEVGAGIGATTRMLCDASHQHWLCLEPDPHLFRQLNTMRTECELPAQCEIRQAVLSDLMGASNYDSLIYIDVLEHIEADRKELVRAVTHLRPGGRLIVLAPAHQSLFSEFDRSIGHHRRYDRVSLLSLTPPGARSVQVRYLDSVGLGASLANKLLLKRALPTSRQIWVWDRLMVPLSRLVDPLALYRIGKSLLVVWERSSAPEI